MRLNLRKNNIEMKKQYWFLVFVFLLATSTTTWSQERDTLICRGRLFISCPVPEQVQTRMMGKSMPVTIPIPFEELRYLILPYYDFEGNIQTGEMICNKSIADDLLHVFKNLFAIQYPINSIRLIDDFDADDEASMQANNTSCFNYRYTDGTSQLSKHAYGRAVDINPLQNPWVRGDKVYPTTAQAYVNRNSNRPHMIKKDDACYKIFTLKGFIWGGDRDRSWDYQHFQK